MLKRDDVASVFQFCIIRLTNLFLLNSLRKIVKNRFLVRRTKTTTYCEHTLLISMLIIFRFVGMVGFHNFFNFNSFRRVVIENGCKITKCCLYNYRSAITLEGIHDVNMSLLRDVHWWRNLRLLAVNFFYTDNKH